MFDLHELLAIQFISSVLGLFAGLAYLWGSVPPPKSKKDVLKNIGKVALISVIGLLGSILIGFLTLAYYIVKDFWELPWEEKKK